MGAERLPKIKLKKNASLQNAAYLLNAQVGTSPLGVADRLVEISILTLAPPCGVFDN